MNLEEEAKKELAKLEFIYKEFKEIASKGLFDKLIIEAAVFDLMLKANKNLKEVVDSLNKETQKDITVNNVINAISNEAPQIFKDSIKLHPLVINAKTFTEAKEASKLNEKDFFFQLTILTKSLSFIKQDLISTLEKGFAQPGVIDVLFNDEADDHTGTPTINEELVFLNHESIRVLNLNNITNLQQLIKAGYRKVEVLLTDANQFKLAVDQIEKLGSITEFINAD